MEYFSRTRIYWLCQIIGWSSYAIFSLVLYVLSEHQLVPLDISGQLLLTCYYIFSTHIYRNLIIKWGWLNTISPNLIPKIILSIIALSISCFLFEIILNFGLGIAVDANDPWGWSIAQFFANLFLYFIWSMVYFVYHYFENYKSALKYQASINEIQLNKLKSQLNPHFIFNGLNSIRALIDENPKKAKVAVTQLSNILRNSLSMNEKKLVNFTEELRTVRDYLELENVRYEERLKTILDIDPESNRFAVPPLMVQTLVENGIKHGIANLVNGGTLKLSTEVQNGQLKIKIKNSGQYHKRTGNGQDGYGIANTVQRLKLLYGDKAKFNISNHDHEFVLTEVTIPELTTL
ncbi:MAG: histidine kinase [Cyclobacteriaceae bacterium]|nr:MAG: histidine kinase [Cyclobacteriaceae bacterium]